MTKGDGMKAWHFVGKALRDGGSIPADGEWLTHDGPVKMCRSGLHASKRIIDALQHAPGSTICRVECSDVVEVGTDKLVCRKRRILWRVDGEELLRDFARRCALDVIHLWDAPDVVVRYLKTGDESLRDAARAAARAAAWDAAWAAAGDAAGAAAGAAAGRSRSLIVSDLNVDTAWLGRWWQAWELGYYPIREQGDKLVVGRIKENI